jgi:hypothetical protein
MKRQVGSLINFVTVPWFEGLVRVVLHLRTTQQRACRGIATTRADELKAGWTLQAHRPPLPITRNNERLIGIRFIA